MSKRISNLIKDSYNFSYHDDIPLVHDSSKICNHIIVNDYIFRIKIIDWNCKISGRNNFKNFILKEGSIQG